MICDFLVDLLKHSKLKSEWGIVVRESEGRSIGNFNSVRNVNINEEGQKEQKQNNQTIQPKQTEL